MALFVNGGVQRTGDGFVEFRALLKVGHVTQSQCSTTIETGAASDEDRPWTIEATDEA